MLSFMIKFHIIAPTLKMFVLTFQWRISLGPVHKYPLVLETETFSQFSKQIRVHKLRFGILFAHPNKNATFTENGTIFNGSMRIYWYLSPRDGDV